MSERADAGSPAGAGTRIGAWTGVAAAAVLLTAFALPAPPPSPDAPAGELMAYLAGRRGRLLASSVMIALGAALYVWFLSVLSAWLAAPGRAHHAGGAVVAAGGTGAAILVCGGGLLSALVLQSATAGEELLRFGFDAANALITIAGASFGASVVATAVTGARTGRLPRSITRWAAVVAPLQLATLAGLAVASGPFAAGGLVALIAFWALAAWFVAVAVRMLRHPGG